MAADILARLLDANLALGAAVLVAALLRTPVRRLFGSQAAYALWAVVPVALLASLMPPRVVNRIVEAAPVAAVPAPVPIAQAVAAPVATGGLAIDQWIILLWLAGIAAFLAYLVIGQHRAVGRFGLLGPDAKRRGVVRAASLAAGPALIGLMRPRVVLPSDFEARFETGEQSMILAHEEAHLKAGHLWINAAGGVIRAINWFNPLVHLAAHLARVDQELACDAVVVARFPGERRTYARAMLKTQLAHASLPLGCYWPGRSPNRLKERIEMLAVDTPTRTRLMTGAATIVALCLGAGAAAWSAQAPQVRTTVIAAPSATPADPLARLAADVSAVFDQGTDPRILLSEEERGVSATRVLRPGEEYRDGWTLDAVATASVTLKKDGQRRTITLEGRKAAPVASVAETVTTPKLAASNAGGQAAVASTDEARTAAMRNAISLGDVRQVMSLNGSASDVAKAFASRGGPMAKLLAAGADATFVEVDGRTGLSVSTGENARGLIMPPEIAGYKPSDIQPLDFPGVSITPNGVGGTTVGISAGAMQIDKEGAITMSGSSAPGSATITIPKGGLGVGL